MDIVPFARLMAENRRKIAAVILEPMVQGAGGMRIYHPLNAQARTPHVRSRRHFADCR